MWWKKNKWKVVVPVLIAAALAAAFYLGGDAPSLRGWSVKETAPAQTQSETTASATETAPETETRPPETETSAAAEETRQETAAGTTAAPETTARAETAAPEKVTQKAGSAVASRPGGTTGGMSAAEKESAAAAIAGETAASAAAQGSESYSEQQGMRLDPKTVRDKYQTEPVPEGKPVPVDPQGAVITDKACTCTISISCAAILDNMGWLVADKKELVPEDGWILKPMQTTFYEGESVFNVLLRTCKQQGIHMEYENTPVYNSAYIEGIHNLYEFDCGELSGWMYRVNDWFPNYGCSRYALKDGDTVAWVYTCDLGSDVGGGSVSGG